MFLNLHNYSSKNQPQVKSSQVKSSQVKSSQVKSSQVKSSQVKSSQARNRVKLVFAENKGLSDLSKASYIKLFTIFLNITICIYFYPSLIFANLDWKGLTVTKTLAYNVVVFINLIKSFIELAHGQRKRNCGNLFERAKDSLAGKFFSTSEKYLRNSYAHS
jgi:hypothetical protein